MRVDLHRRARGAPLAAGVLELAGQFLLRGVDADHRVAAGVPLAVAASGERSLALARQFGDGLVATDSDAELVRGFGGQGKPVYGQLPICFDPDRQVAVERAHRLWRWSTAGWKVMAELPAPVNFAAYAQSVRPEDVAATVPCGPDVDAVVQAVRAYTDAGFTHVALVQIGHEHQDAFLQWSAKELLPALREGV
jgi:G6PDH family F420-dependent oxidoreductase